MEGGGGCGGGLTHQCDDGGGGDVGNKDDDQGDDDGVRYGATGVHRLLPRRGDDVEPDEGVEAGGGARQHLQEEEVLRHG